MSSKKLVNRAALKEYSLDISARYKKGKFTIVSAAFMDEVEEHMRMYVYRKVTRHPFIGKTLKPETERED